jgi:hypothetical protein
MRPDDCLVCQMYVDEVQGKVTVASGVIHMDCVSAVARYRNAGWDTKGAVSLVRRDMRAEARRASHA